MRLVVCALALASATAAADPMLYEWNAGTPLRPAEELRLGACAIDATFRGAMVELELRQKISNPGPGELAAAFEVELPQAASLIGVAVDRVTSIGVPVNPPKELVDSPDVLAADPALAVRVSTEQGRSRYRAILRPVRGEITLALRWTEVADIHDGAMHAKLLGRIDGSACVVATRVLVGTGVTAKPPPPFTMTSSDAAIDVPLEVAGKEPVAWLQTAALGDGQVAQALTVIAPALRADTGPHRVLFVIDTSRSMDLVGRGNVRKLVTAIGNALPQGSTVEAILYDHTAERVFKMWKPNPGGLDEALAKHAALNGSDLAGALALAKQALAEPGAPRGQAMVISISDGVLGGVTPAALATALGGKLDALDFHALVLDPHGMRTQDGDALRGLVTTYGGSYVEVSIDERDEAIAGVASWLRPAWQDLAVAGWTLPAEVRAGTGFTVTRIAGKPGALTLKARGDAAVTAAVSPLPAAPIAQLVLAPLDDDDFGIGEAGEKARAKLARRFPAADDEHDLAVPATQGRIAAQRRQLLANGGSYTRTVDFADPAFVPSIHIGTTTVSGGSALDRTIIKRLLVDQLQPHAYACYARSLGRMVALAGTATFTVELARGEVTRVAVGGFEANPEFATCLVEAAYGMAPPMPTPGYNTDDRSVVSYALTFSMRDKQPSVAAGETTTNTTDETPATTQRPKLQVDPSTSLGGLKPTP